MNKPRRPRLGLRLRYALVALVYGAVVAALTLAIDRWIDPSWLAAGAAVALSLLPLWLLIGRELDPMRSLFRALAGTVTSYRDGDFAFGLALGPQRRARRSGATPTTRSATPCASSA
jgi:two-component system nitrogen regulation sensor histidine kinase NtrY